MAIINPIDDLLEIVSGFALRQTSFANQIFKKLSSFHVFQDEISIFGTTH
jgi:hypothetical protein